MAIETTVGDSMTSTDKKRVPAKRRRPGQRMKKRKTSQSGRTSPASAASGQKPSTQPVKQLDVAAVAGPVSATSGAAVVDKKKRTAHRRALRRTAAWSPAAAARPRAPSGGPKDAAVRGGKEEAPAAPRERVVGEEAKPAEARRPVARRRSAAKPKAKSAKTEPRAVRAEVGKPEAKEDQEPILRLDDDQAVRQMVINVSGGDECRIAILHQGRLEELFIERSSSQSHVGNIYKGLVTNIEPSIQAVFVDFGQPKNGFLHISDVQSKYFPEHDREPEDVGRKIPRMNRPPIQKCFRRGQEVIVQVTKEGVGTKGPTLTTYLSIPGRFLVMMPGMSRHGVSRRIEDEAQRRKMRDMLNELKLPSGKGFILRTAGLGRTKRELQQDLNYLLRLWKTVVTRVKEFSAPVELYQESDLVTRTIRDVYTTDFERVIVDDAETAQKVTEFLQIAMPRSKAVVDVYTEREPLFHRLGIEGEIERINLRQVPLPLGGSLVIESTEALVAIDVNSGRFRSLDDAEETALRINLEAAEEIARQLRLRDLGGLIVCDFIDMRLERHKRAVEQALRDALKKHKERAQALRMSRFGLIELTRQRQGPSIKRNIYFDCPHCKGAGMVKMPESVILDVMRTIQLAVHREEVQRVTVTVASDVAFQILNDKRAALNQIEAETEKEVVIRGDPVFTSDQIQYACEDSRGQPVVIGRATPPVSGSRGGPTGIDQNPRW